MFQDRSSSGEPDPRSSILTAVVGDRRAEVELLLAASRPHADEAIQSRIAYLASTDIDWDYVAMQAVAHGTTALLYSNLRRAGVQIQTAEMKRLDHMARESANRSLYLLGELLKILAAFENAKIPAIPLKGATLAVTAYGDVSCRQFSDLDVLIQERDISRAREVLARLGFRCVHHSDWIEPYMRFGHELDFISSDGTVQVDLQWRFAKKWLSLPVDALTVWDHASSATIGGQSLRQASLEDTLLILCCHGYRHRWSRLKWIVDVAAFLHRFGERLDAIRLFERTQAHGGRRMVMLGLWLAQEVAGSVLPLSIQRSFAMDPKVECIGRAIIERLFDVPLAGPRGSHGLIAAVAFHLRARERLRDKLPAFVPLLSQVAYILRRQARHHAQRFLAVSSRICPP
jgi:hypothetical protein